MPAIKTFNLDVKIWFPMSHWISYLRNQFCLLSANAPQVYAILFDYASSKGSGESAHEILFQENIFGGMPDIPDNFGGEHSWYQVHAYVWRKVLSPLNLQKMLDIVYAYVWCMPERSCVLMFSLNKRTKAAYLFCIGNEQLREESTTTYLGILRDVA